jgi:hypothetical protein
MVNIKNAEWHKMKVGKIVPLDNKPYTSFNVFKEAYDEVQFLRKQNELLRQFLSVYRDIMNNIQDVKGEKFEDAFFV